MKRPHILVVDDEPFNLEIIRSFLGDTVYDLDAVESGEAAWDRLRTGGKYDLILLDHLMPGISGLDLLQRIKGTPQLRDIPVIVQTAANTSEQMREGIEAGAYYFLIKPYQAEVLLSIVRAALVEADKRSAARRLVATHEQALALLDCAEFAFSSIESIPPLVELLASMSPEPERAVLGLTELLTNAVEHGNLGIGYEEKRKLRLENTLDAEVMRRLGLPEYRDRRVRVMVERHPDYLSFVIRDDGAGFDWRPYLSLDPGRAADPNGRGIAMARMVSFDSLEYRDNGRLAVANLACKPPPSRN